MKSLSFILMMAGFVLFSSCAGNCPSLKDPAKGIVAIRVEATNRTGFDFYRFFKIFPLLSSDYEIVVYPRSGKSFAFSSEMVPGGYSFNRIVDSPWDKGGNTIGGAKSSEQKLYGGIHLDVAPGKVTIADQKLIIKLYESKAGLSGDKSYQMSWEWVRVSNDEMSDLIEEFKRIDTDDQWKIANTTSSPAISSKKANIEELAEAAEQGNAEAQFSLGLMYNYGEGVPKDCSEAMKWYRKAADLEYELAQYKLGIEYDEGLCVPQDYAEAAKWYRKAAEQGEAEAQYNLAVMYYDGRGVPQDYSEAMEWYRRSAEQEDTKAQVNLGLMYYEGRGVLRDNLLSYMWLDIADANGDVRAATIQARVTRKMTPENISRAKSMARECIKSNYHKCGW